MAMSGGSDDGQPMMEMNTTPLIDVMLVLLIMLMITVPPVTHAVDIDTPPPSENPPPDVIKPEVNTVNISETSVVSWNGTPVSLQQLSGYLAQTRAMSPQPELHFQPLPNAPYDTVDKTLAVVKRSKISGFGFVGNEAYRVFGKSATPGG